MSETFELTFRDYTAICRHDPRLDEAGEWLGEIIGQRHTLRFRTETKEALMDAFIATCDDYEGWRPDRAERADILDPRG